MPTINLIRTMVVERHTYTPFLRYKSYITEQPEALIVVLSVESCEMFCGALTSFVIIRNPPTKGVAFTPVGNPTR